MRDAEVRFYVDADVLGLGKVLAALRSDVTYPGDGGAVIKRRQRPSCPITSPGVRDTVWIPQVASRGWLAITRDAQITGHSRELAAVREHEAKLVVLSSRAASSPWGQLEIVMSQWRQIDVLQRQPGPFVVALSRTSARKIDLSG